MSDGFNLLRFCCCPEFYNARVCVYVCVNEECSALSYKASLVERSTAHHYYHPQLANHHTTDRSFIEHKSSNRLKN